MVTRRAICASMLVRRPKADISGVFVAMSSGWRQKEAAGVCAVGFQHMLMASQSESSLVQTLIQKGMGQVNGAANDWSNGAGAG